MLCVETFLQTLFIVLNANITDEGSLGTGSFAWSYVCTIAIPGMFCESNTVYLMILRRHGHERGGGDSRETFILESVPAVLDVYS
jgi:hypothetical protein